jgi:hypothetical protein
MKLAAGSWQFAFGKFAYAGKWMLKTKVWLKPIIESEFFFNFQYLK